MSLLIKSQLFQECLNLIDQRIRQADEQVKSTQAIANESGKSSAGDKYETTREVLQQEINRYLNQKQEALKLKKALTVINPQKSSDNIDHGSLVTTNAGTYFLAVSLGNVLVNNFNYMVISVGSPLGQQLIGREAGDTFTFNNRAFHIENIQ